MIRTILAIIVGLICGMAVNLLIVIIVSAVWPMSEGVDFNDADGTAAYIATLPVLALLLVILAHLLQAFVGGWVAAALTRNVPMLAALAVGVLSLLAGVYNMMSMPLPAWMWIEVPLYLIVAWLAGQLVARRRMRRAAASPQQPPA